MTGNANLPPGTGGTPGTLPSLPQVHERASAGVCASVPPVPSVPPSISSKTIKEIDRNGGRNAPERLSWFVAEVVSNAEKAVVEQLDREQPDRDPIPAWCPVETHVTRHSRKQARKRYSVPLLPGYVFVRLPVDTDGVLEAGMIDALREASPLVKGLVSASGKPRPVADRWIEALETAERLGAFDYQPRGRPNYTYAKGEKVRILSGVMTNRIAEFVCNKSGRLKLLLEPIDAAGQVIVGGKPISTKVKPDQVEPLDPPPIEPTPAEQGLWPPPPSITA